VSSQQRRLRLLAVALRGTLRFRLQTTLVLLAAVGGVAAVVVSSAYAQSATRAILARYEALGANMVVVTPAASRAVGGRARTGAPVTTLTLADYRALRATEPEVTAASATVSATYRLRAGDLTKSVEVIGCEPDYFAIKHWPVVRGAVFSPQASREGARLVLLGAGVARDLFGETDPTGRRLTINRAPFTVAGVLTERGRRLDGSDEDDQAYVPLVAGLHRLMNVDHLGGVMLQAERGSEVRRVAARAAVLLATRHRRFGGRQPDFTVTDQQLVLEDQLAAFRRFDLLVRSISLCALAVGAVGAAAVCWISVNARRTDIGAMRALGARRGDVLLVFVAEALAPALLGTAAGLGLGYAAARALEARLGQPPWFEWNGALLDVILCAAVFAFAIALTSRRATLIAPIAALSAS